MHFVEKLPAQITYFKNNITYRIAISNKELVLQ